MTLAADGASYPVSSCTNVCHLSGVLQEASYYSVDMFNVLSLAGLYSHTTTKLSNSGSAYQFEFVQVSKSLSS